ncbi:MAG: sigma 54-interacting transcriptional regulator [Thermoanaerobaculaceae bacterium]|nr:sigma 54-interacting transcriptional regulator [Thermoanaerobaculaceae bacterium]
MGVGKKKTFFLFLKILLFIYIFFVFSKAHFCYYVEKKSKMIFSNWTTENGLIQNSVRSILKSKEGYLLLGTFGGICKFDGKEFSSLAILKEGEFFKGSRVAKLFIDSKDRLWVATENKKIFIFEKEKIKIIDWTNEGYDVVNVNDIVEIEDGTICVGTDGGLFFLKDEKIINVIMDRLPSISVKSLYKTKNGELLIGTTKGLAILKDRKIEIFPLIKYQILTFFEDEDGTIYAGTEAYLIKIRGKSVQYIKSKQILSIAKDKKGNFWIGSFKGLYIFQNNSLNLFEGFFDYVEKKDVKITSLLVDEENNLWVGSDGDGLFKISYPLVEFYGKEDGIYGETVASVFADYDGSIIFSSYYPDGVIYRLKDGKIEKSKWNNKVITSIFRTKDKTFWIGTWNSGLIKLKNGKIEIYNSENGLPCNDINALFEDSKGNLWVGTQKGVAVLKNERIEKIYDWKNGLLQGVVNSVSEDRGGNIWVGTSNGINLVKGEKIISITEKDGLPYENVRGIYEDSEGTVWIAAYGGGLTRFKEGKFFNFSTKDGLKSDFLSYIVEDNNKSLYISSNDTIMKIRIQDLNDYADGKTSFLKIGFYGKGEGMLSSECNGRNQPSLTVGKDGKIWFATIKGIVGINPNITFPPPSTPIIEYVKVNNKMADYKNENPTFGKGKIDISFKYTAPIFLSNDYARFIYKLEGYDNDWKNGGKDRIAIYTGLKPKDYRLLVSVFDSKGNKCASDAVFPFVVKPYFYQTNLFFIFLFIVSLSLIVLIFKYRTYALRKRALLLEEKVKENTAVLLMKTEELNEVNSKIKRVNEYLTALFEKMKTAAVVVNNDLNVVFVNEPFKKIFNLDESITNTNLLKVLPIREKTNEELVKNLKNYPNSLNRLLLQIKMKNDETFFSEIEIFTHPSNPELKIIFFYELTEIINKEMKNKSFLGNYFILGRNPKMLQIAKQIEVLSKVDTTVLIRGETGVGKEVIAKTIHSLSERKEKPFVVINCAGLTETLLASQLFGHKKGSFTGAASDQKGLFAAANGGTVFLDEIGDMPLDGQKVLLRVLQEKEILKVGETKPEKIDVRFLAATNRDLEKLSSEGKFRLDLFYRIKVAEINVFPLRERKEDIVFYVNYFLEEFKKYNKNIIGFSKEAMDFLLQYDWPGNIRELRNVVEHCVINSNSFAITIENLPHYLRNEIFSKNKIEVDDRKIYKDKRELLLEAIKESGGNITRVCEILNVSRMTVYRWMKRYNIDKNEIDKTK